MCGSKMWTFDRWVLVVREGKGSKDRVVMLPHTLDAAFKAQMVQARTLWEHDRQQHQPGVEVPDALATKYPDLGQRWGWFWLFPSPKLSVDPRSRIERRHHLCEERLRKRQTRWTSFVFDNVITREDYQRKHES